MAKLLGRRATFSESRSRHLLVMSRTKEGKKEMISIAHGRLGPVFVSGTFQVRFPSRFFASSKSGLSDPSVNAA